MQIFGYGYFRICDYFSYLLFSRPLSLSYMFYSFQPYLTSFIPKTCILFFSDETEYEYSGSEEEEEERDIGEPRYTDLLRSHT